ncbi:MAG: cytochrome c [Acidobacteriota bacterium]|nr:cytochrome c [Acidobacteriota bacterium]
MRTSHVLLAIVALVYILPRPARSAGPEPRKVTFSKDVAPIFYQHCAGCHRLNDIAPMSLLTYKDARPWAAAVRQAVTLRKMPPWYADPHYGKFANDPRLSETEIQTITAWVQQGAPEGNPADLPARPNFNDNWKIGVLDAIVDIGQDYQVEKRDVPDEYIYFTVDPHFTKDVWVKAVELRPGNRRVVHHAHVWIETPPNPRPALGADGKPLPNYQYKDQYGLAHIKPPMHRSSRTAASPKMAEICRAARLTTA